MGHEEGPPPPPPPPPRNPNQDILDAIQALIGVVHQRLPPPVVQQGQQIPVVIAQDLGGGGAEGRERSRSPPLRQAEGQGEHEGESIHQRGPPHDRHPRHIGDDIRELIRLGPPLFTGATEGTVAEAWIQSLQRCFGLRPYGSNLKA